MMTPIEGLWPKSIDYLRVVECDGDLRRGHESCGNSSKQSRQSSVVLACHARPRGCKHIGTAIKLQPERL